MKKIEIFENQRASNYDQFVEAWIPNYHYFMETVPKLLKETARKDLLVVGCGAGTEIEYMVQYSDDWEITGTDPSPEMIAQAQSRLGEFEHVKLWKGLVSDMDLSKTYGAATLLLVLHFMEDDGTKLSLLKDIAERLEEGAPFIMLDITGDPTQMEENLEILRLLIPNDYDEQAIQNRIERIRHKLHMVSEDRIIELLIEAGFERPHRFFQTSIYMGWITQKK